MCIRDSVTAEAGGYAPAVPRGGVVVIPGKLAVAAGVVLALVGAEVALGLDAAPDADEAPVAPVDDRAVQPASRRTMPGSATRPNNSEQATGNTLASRLPKADPPTAPTAFVSLGVLRPVDRMIRNPMGSQLLLRFQTALWRSGPSFNR